MAVILGLGVLESHAQTKEMKVHHEKHVRQEMTPEQRAERETQRMAKELSLTTEQQAKFKSFALERMNEAAPLRAKMKSNTDKTERGQLFKDMKGIREKFDSNVKSILTEEQLPKWDERKKEMHHRRHHHQCDHGKSHHKVKPGTK